jgi:hypothetical protein
MVLVAQQIETVAVGQPEIHEHHVGVRLPDALTGFFSDPASRTSKPSRDTSRPELGRKCSSSSTTRPTALTAFFTDSVAP